MSSSYSNYEQTIVLNGYALSGVQSVDGSYGIAEKPVRVAGVGFIDALIESPLQGNFSINRTMVSADPMLETDSIGKYKFDEDEISGVILYSNKTKGFGFTQARLNRYSVSCTVGQLPEIQTDFTVYGELGRDVLKSFTAVVDENHENYPWNKSSVFLTDSDGNTVGENISYAYNNRSIELTEEEYNSLHPTDIIDGGIILRLGQEAFKIERSYDDIVQYNHPPTQFTDQASMRVTVSDFSIDAISDFSFTRTLNLTPVYGLPRGTEADWVAGSKPSVPNLQPVQVDPQYPIETDINFTMIANEYEIREIKDRIQSAPKSTVSIEIRDGQTKEMINAYTGHNVRLIGESINSSIEGEMSISLTYKGYDTLHNSIDGYE